MTESNENILNEVESILDGAGWATDGYIINHSNLTRSEKFKAMIKLANIGRLYNEDIIGDYNEDSQPKIGKMSSYFVWKKYHRMCNNHKKKIV